MTTVRDNSVGAGAPGSLLTRTFIYSILDAGMGSFCISFDISVTQRPKEIQKLPIPASNIEYMNVLVRREPGAPAPTELSRTVVIMCLVYLASSDSDLVT